MTDAPETEEQGDNHVAPPAVDLDAARALARTNEALGFPVPPAVQAVIDAADAAKPRARAPAKPAVSAADQSETAR